MNSLSGGRTGRGPWSANTTTIAASKPVELGSFAPESRAPTCPVREGTDDRQEDLGRGDESDPSEDELDIAQPVERVGDEPDERERRHEAEPADERTRIYCAVHEQRVKRKSQRR